MSQLEFPQQDTQCFFNGPDGRLEAVVELPKASILPITAIICHPHPLQHGTMNNKVVTTLARALRQLGLTTIRFNFRGVGQSEGRYADAIGETDDLLAIIAWLNKVRPQNKLWLAGFSFGSYVAYRAASQIASVAQLISVAPPVHHFDFASLPQPECPWLVLQGDKDEVVPPALVFEWVDSLIVKPELLVFKDVGHFFHGRLIELRERVEAALQSNLNLS